MRIAAFSASNKLKKNSKTTLEFTELTFGVELEDALAITEAIEI